MENKREKKVKEFAQMEKELNLFDRKYNEKQYWHMLRFFCCEAAFTKRMETSKIISVLNKKERNISFFINLIIHNIKSFFQYFFPQKIDVLMFSISRLHNRFFNYLELPETVKTKLYRVDLPENHNDKNENFIPDLFLILKTKFISSIKSDKKEYEFLIYLENEMIKRFGQSLSASEMEQLITSYLNKQKIYCNYYERLLKKSKCKIIIITCYYSNKHFYLIETAHKLNIPVIELQHGVINNHINYWYENQTGKYDYIPDYLLTFGTEHEKWIKLPKKEKVISVGYPHQEIRLKQLDDIKTDEKLIIVYPKISESFEKEIDELANIITKEGFSVIVKMHPGEAKHHEIYYPIISKNKNIKIITDQSNDIYYWLKKAKFHIMTSSTVGLEAMMFENTNIFISLNTEHAQCQPLLDWNVAKVYNNTNELIDFIKSPENLDKSVCRNLLWKQNSIKNIKKIILSILNKNLENI